MAPLQARALLAAGKPRAVAQAHATLGDWPAARDKLALARERFQTLLRGTPDNLMLLQSAAGADLAGATRSARRALDLAPLSLPARQLAIRLALRQNQPAQALAIAQELHKLQPGDAAGLVQQAEVEITRKRWDAALLPLRKALALAADKQVGKAIELQLRALAMRPSDPFMRLNLARFYAQAGEKRKAKAELDRLEALGDRFAKQTEVAVLSKGLGGR